MAHIPSKVLPTELEKQQAEKIKKLEVMVQVLQKQLMQSNIQYKRLMFDHNNTKYELNFLRQKVAKNG
jgi:CRISPR/Cas system endoribonuclease Cas6 (RAMP superfamily)